MILSPKQLESLAVVTDWQMSCDALEQAIVRQILHRTGGRIQRLEVEVAGDAVIIRGRTPSYYLKQLALQGVLDRLGSAGQMRIELNVEVSNSAPSRAVLHS